MRLGERPKDCVRIDVKIFGDALSESKGFILTKKILAINVDVDVKPGECLEVTLTPLTSESVVKEVWVSMLWAPNAANIESFLIEELEKNMKEFIEEVDEKEPKLLE